MQAVAITLKEAKKWEATAPISLKVVEARMWQATSRVVMRKVVVVDWLNGLVS